MKKVIPAKPRDKQTRGRLIPAEHLVTHRFAGVSTRPLKLAFLINEATPKLDFIHF